MDPLKALNQKEDRLEKRIMDLDVAQLRADLEAEKDELFRTCIIPMVPQLYKTGGWRRRTRLCLMAICLLGLLYQVGGFVQLFLYYPTVLLIDIEYPESILAPSFTFCNRAGINKLKYCDHFPSHCFNNSEGEIQVKMEEVMKIQRHGTKELYEKFSPTIKDILYFQMTAWDAKDYLFDNNTITMTMPDELGYRMVCHIFNHQIWEIQSAPLMIPSKPWDMHHIYRTLIQGGLIYNKTYFTVPNFERAFTLNSPYQLENPFLTGLHFESDGIDVFSLTLEEFHLLKAPYKTDCYDYLEMRRKTGKGPMSQQMCRDKCVYEKTLSVCSCVPAHLLYPAPGRFCEEEDQECLNSIDIDVCYSKCKRDCIVYKYKYTMRKLQVEYAIDIVMSFISLSLDKEPQFEINPLELDWREPELFGIAFKKTEKMVYRYMPKYTTVELFCYVGGYIGMWLAFSTPDLADLLHVVWKWRQLEKKRIRLEAQGPGAPAQTALRDL